MSKLCLLLQFLDYSFTATLFWIIDVMLHLFIIFLIIHFLIKCFFYWEMINILIYNEE